jgi:hypothetical protein
MNDAKHAGCGIHAGCGSGSTSADVAYSEHVNPQWVRLLSLLEMNRSRWLRRRSLRALSREPGLFAKMLAVHVGEMRLKDFGASGLLNLGWHLLRA